MILELAAAGLLLVLVEAPSTPSVGADSVRTTPAAPSDQALEHLRRELGDQWALRVWVQGKRVELDQPRVTDFGIDFDRASEPIPRPIPWNQVDSVWTRHTRAGTFALLGALAGATAVYLKVGPVESEGDLANPFLVTLGGVGGFLAGAILGNARVIWELSYPLDPEKMRTPRRSLLRP